MLEFGLPWHLSVEVDGLYHPLSYTFAGIEPNGTLNSVSPATVVTWEFPALAKYRFSLGSWTPFVVRTRRIPVLRGAWVSRSGCTE